MRGSRGCERKRNGAGPDFNPRFRLAIGEDIVALQMQDIEKPRQTKLRMPENGGVHARSFSRRVQRDQLPLLRRHVEVETG